MHEDKIILNGLVLAGGKSRRMGQDKTAIQWHGKAQQYYMADLLQWFCKDVFICCRADQIADTDPAYKTIADAGAGPYAAIVAAFEQNKICAWLVTASDLPLLDKLTLQYLASKRNYNCIATSFESPYNKMPEPLIAIWEPQSYPLLISFAEKGYSCPKTFLHENINRVKILQAPDPDALMNVNTPQDAEKAWQIINKKKLSA